MGNINRAAIFANLSNDLKTQEIQNPVDLPIPVQAPPLQQSIADNVDATNYTPGHGGIEGGPIDAKGKPLSPRDLVAAVVDLRKNDDPKATDGIPYGSKIKITNKETGEFIIVTVKDTGSWHKRGNGIKSDNRAVDLTDAAYQAIGTPKQRKSGKIRISIELVSVPNGIKQKQFSITVPGPNKTLRRVPLTLPGQTATPTSPQPGKEKVPAQVQSPDAAFIGDVPTDFPGFS